MAEEFEDPTSRYQNPRYSGKGVPDRARDPRRTATYSKQFSNQEEINSMTKKIREERRAKAMPGTPESKGYWTDRSGLH